MPISSRRSCRSRVARRSWRNSRRTLRASRLVAGAPPVAGPLRRTLPVRQRMGHAVASLLCGRHRDGARAVVAHRAGFGTGARRSAGPRDASQARRKTRKGRIHNDLLPLISWVETVVAAGGRHPRERPRRRCASRSKAACTACFTRTKPRRSHARRAAWSASSHACCRSARRSGNAVARPPERRETYRVGGTTGPAGSEDRRQGAELHRQRRAHGLRCRRARRPSAR